MSLITHTCRQYPAAGSGQQAGNIQQQTAAGSCRRQRVGSRQQSSGSKQQAACSRQEGTGSGRQQAAANSRQQADAKPEQEMEFHMFGNVCLERCQMPNPNKKRGVQVGAPCMWASAWAPGRCQTQTRNGVSDVRQCLFGTLPNAKPKQEMRVQVGAPCMWASA